MQTLTTIPAHDRDDYFRLPEAEQARIKDLIERCFPIVARADKRTIGYRQAARICPAYSPSTIKRCWIAFQRHGWRALIRNYRGPQKLPEPFIQYWKALTERHQRNSKAAWRQLIRDWKDWQKGDTEAAMPGYAAAPPADPRTGLPDGWTYANLMLHAPSKFELTTVRISTHASAADRRLVFSTRVGLAVGEFYQFDDVWHDHKVNVLGQRIAQRPLEFNCIDVYSACKNAWAIKPIIESHDGLTKTKRLNEREMLLLAVGTLATEGYRPQGTTLILEHGTAALSAEIEAALSDYTDGAVRINRSGIDGGEAFTGQYAGQGKGNYRLKAALESLHNLMHNEFQSLPGQVGKDRYHSPAELYGRDKANNALIQACAAIAQQDPDLARQLIFPYVELSQFRNFAAAVYDRINNRTDHQLEGWIEAGLTTTEWRPAYNLPWVDQDKLLAMPDANRNAVMALLDTDPSLLRTRRMSPAEVYHQGKRNLVKLPRSSAAMLLKDAIGRPIKVRTQAMIEFEDAEAGPGTFRFLARVRDAHGRETLLNKGEEFFGIMNPYFPDTLDLIDAKGRWIGSCPTIHAPCKNDEDGLNRALGEANRINTELLAPLRYRGREILKQRIADTQQNNLTLSGGNEPAKPRSNSDKNRLRKLREREDPADLIGEATTDTIDDPDLQDPFDSSELM